MQALRWLVTVDSRRMLKLTRHALLAPDLVRLRAPARRNAMVCTLVKAAKKRQVTIKICNLEREYMYKKQKRQHWDHKA